MLLMMLLMQLPNNAAIADAADDATADDAIVAEAYIPFLPKLKSTSSASCMTYGVQKSVY